MVIDHIDNAHELLPEIKSVVKVYLLMLSFYDIYKRALEAIKDGHVLRECLCFRIIWELEPSSRVPPIVEFLFFARYRTRQDHALIIRAERKVNRIFDCYDVSDSEEDLDSDDTFLVTREMETISCDPTRMIISGYTDLLYDLSKRNLVRLLTTGLGKGIPYSLYLKNSSFNRDQMDVNHYPYYADDDTEGFSRRHHDHTQLQLGTIALLIQLLLKE